MCRKEFLLSFTSKESNKENSQLQSFFHRIYSYLAAACQKLWRLHFRVYDGFSFDLLPVSAFVSHTEASFGSSGPYGGAVCLNVYEVRGNV
ncbi:MULTISPECIES: hypothetical protein [Olivibacter]|uniref:Uncharacterized protein n=1 Tax=Olivibacter jilunii TaxID=985016 RepID=A0ABW6B786_9SPHI